VPGRKKRRVNGRGVKSHAKVERGTHHRHGLGIRPKVNDKEGEKRGPWERREQKKGRRKKFDRGRSIQNGTLSGAKIKIERNQSEFSWLRGPEDIGKGEQRLKNGTSSRWGNQWGLGM